MKMASKLTGILAIASIGLMVNTVHAGAANNKKANSGWDKEVSVNLNLCDETTVTLIGKVHFVYKKALDPTGFALNYNTARLKSAVDEGVYYELNASGQISGTQFDVASPPVVIPDMTGAYVIKNESDDSIAVNGGPYDVTFDLTVAPSEGKSLDINLDNVFQSDCSDSE